MKTSLLFNFLIILIVLLSGCKKDDKRELSKEIYIGVVLPLDVFKGELRLYALKTAVDEINESEKVLGGYQIKIDVRSSEPVGGVNREDYAVTVANSILNDHSSSLIGFISSWSSSSRGIALQVSDPNHIPQIACASTSSANSGISDYFQRLTPPDSSLNEILAKKAKEFGINKVAIAVQSGDVFSEGIASGFKEKFEAIGGTITSTVNFVENDTSIIEKLETLYADEPDAVFIAMVSLDVEFLNAVNDNAISLNLDIADLRFVFTDSQRHLNLLEQVPAGLITSTTETRPKAFGAIAFPDIATNSYIHFKEELTRRYNKETESFSHQHYDAVYLFALAMERALEEGANLSNISSFREAVNRNIRKVSRDDSGEITVSPEQGWTSMQTAARKGDVNYTGASGNCDINKNGDVKMNYDVYIVLNDGAGTLEFKTIENINPNDLK